MQCRLGATIKPRFGSGGGNLTPNSEYFSVFGGVMVRMEVSMQG